jgi:PQQ-dependent catabolism-associated beta-propeller protein
MDVAMSEGGVATLEGSRVPGAVQHEVLLRRTGTPVIPSDNITGAPDQQRTTPQQRRDAQHPGHPAAISSMRPVSRAATLLAMTIAALCLFVASPASAYIAYVSNEKSNTVSVIDTESWTVTKTIKVGQRPRGIEFSRNGKLVMVAVGDDDKIEVIDVASQQVVDSLPSGPDPELFTQDAAGKIMYVANENDNTVTVIDLDKRVRVGEIQVGVEPEGMALSPDGKILINTSETTNMAHFIDTATRQIVANVLVDARPRFAEFKRDLSELWVSSEIGGTVSVIDPARHQVIDKISFAIPGLRREAIQPVGIGMTRDGSTAFVALGPANRVAVVDVATHKVIKYLLVGQRVWHLAFTPDEKYLLTTNGVSNDVSVIDVAAQKVFKTIQVGELPWGITIAPP